MTLSIKKLRTRCRYPKRLDRVPLLVDGVSTGPLAEELGAQLGPSLDRLPAVIRLRDLRVRLRIPASRISAATLASAWARAFTLALHRALAYPDGEGNVGIFRYESDNAYKASLLFHIATKGLEPNWQFPELGAWAHFTPKEAILGMLLAETEFSLAILSHLAERNWLESVIALMDEPALERLIQAIVKLEFTKSELTLDDLIALGSAAFAPGGINPRWPLGSRRQAFRLWSRLQQRYPVQGIWHALRLFVRLLEMPSQSDWKVPIQFKDKIAFPQWCQEIEASFVSSNSMARGTTLESGIARLQSILADLRPLLPTAPVPNEIAQWIHSDVAGILLLLAGVRRLGYWRWAAGSDVLKFGGPRAFSFYLAAVGMTLLGKWKPGDPVDPAVALFAGIFAEPDRSGMKLFFEDASIPKTREFRSGNTCREALDAACTELTADLARRVRGFRQATSGAIVRQFIRIPGRVLVEQERLLVILAPNPVAAALHISGADESLHSVEWLGGRRVDFVLEGI